MSQFFGDYITVFAFLALGFALVLVILGAGSLIRPKNPTAAKAETYECGIDPVGGGWSQTHIRYYVFALLFLIFDVEAVFIFPWAIRVEQLEWFAVGEMALFIVILAMGLAYAVKKGVLRWE